MSRFERRAREREREKRQRRFVPLSRARIFSLIMPMQNTKQCAVPVDPGSKAEKGEVEGASKFSRLQAKNLGRQSALFREVGVVWYSSSTVQGTLYVAVLWCSTQVLTEWNTGNTSESRMTWVGFQGWEGSSKGSRSTNCKVPYDNNSHPRARNFNEE